MISHPFIAFGKQAMAGQPAPSAVQGGFVRRLGSNRNIVTLEQSYRETIVEPQQTDRETKL